MDVVKCKENVWMGIELVFQEDAFYEVSSRFERDKNRLFTTDEQGDEHQIAESDNDTLLDYLKDSEWFREHFVCFLSEDD